MFQEGFLPIPKKILQRRFMFIFVCPCLSCTSARQFLLTLNESYWNYEQELKCEPKLKSILKKHSSLFPFQILTCQDQKSVCPLKATFFPRDIFKVNRRPSFISSANLTFILQLSLSSNINFYIFSINIFNLKFPSPYL